MLTGDSPEWVLRSLVSDHRRKGEHICVTCIRTDCCSCFHSKCVMSCWSCCRSCNQTLADCDCQVQESPSLDLLVVVTSIENHASRGMCRLCSSNQCATCSHSKCVMKCLNCCRRCWRRYQSCSCSISKSQCKRCRQDSCQPCMHQRCVVRCLTCKADRRTKTNSHCLCF